MRSTFEAASPEVTASSETLEWVSVGSRPQSVFFDLYMSPSVPHHMMQAFFGFSPMFLQPALPCDMHSSASHVKTSYPKFRPRCESFELESDARLFSRGLQAAGRDHRNRFVLDLWLLWWIRLGAAALLPLSLSLLEAVGAGSARSIV